MATATRRQDIAFALQAIAPELAEQLQRINLGDEEIDTLERFLTHYHTSTRRSEISVPELERQAKEYQVESKQMLVTEQHTWIRPVIPTPGFTMSQLPGSKSSYSV